MDTTPLVSIICITYNHEKFISEAIEGFLIQETSFPFEIIIHDDASTDSTREIVKKYESKYPEKIKGIYQSVNQYSLGKKITPLALPFCKGKYVALCEGDDFWVNPLKLQKQAAFLEENPEYAGAFHETKVIDCEGNFFQRIYGREAPEIFTAEDSFAKLSPFHTSSFLFRKEDVVKLPAWFNKVFSGDMALFSIVAAKGPLKKIPEVMSVYRKHDDGITSNHQAIITYHKKRKVLIKFLNKYHRYKYNDKAIELINHHENHIKRPFLYRFFRKAKRLSIGYFGNFLKR